MFDMKMPADFSYREVYLRGKPQHNKNDAFRCLHPAMAVSRRAKIFQPFDALKGLRESLAAQELRPERQDFVFNK